MTAAEALAANGARPGLTKLTVSLTPRSMRALNSAARRSGRSRTDVVNMAVQRYAATLHIAPADPAAARIAAVEAERDEWRRLACTDPLTGLANRRVLGSELAARRASGEAWTAVVIDLDHFKHINDTYGHPVGDAVIACVAQRIKAVVAALGSLAVRLGGDEFLLVGRSPWLGEAALARLCGPVVIGAYRVQVSVSVGVCTAAACDDPARVLHAADRAAQAAKNAGRGRLVTYDRALLGLPEMDVRPKDPRIRDERSGGAR